MGNKTPVYEVKGAASKSGALIPAAGADADGYRLPTVREWAARGGVSSGNSNYSGSKRADAVAWYFGNASRAVKAVGTKAANELGL